MATTTANLGLTKPTVGADADAWGGQLNASLDTLDAKVLDKTTGGTVSGNLTVTGTVNTPNVNAATALNLQTGGSTKATLDTAGNLGLGVTPSAWGSGFRSFDVGTAASYSGNSTSSLFASQNAYNNGTNWIYKSSTPNIGAQLFGLNPNGAGGHAWFTAPSGTAGAPITFTQAMTLTQGGNLLINAATGPTGAKLYIQDGNSDLTTYGSAQIVRTAATGTVWHYAAIAAGAEICGIGFDSANNATFGNGNSPNALGSFLKATNASGLVFGTQNTERARMTTTGDFLLGTTTFRARMTVEANSQLTAVPYDSNDTRADTASAASFFFRRQGTIVGNISTTTTATSFNTSSDYRLKNNQQPLTGSGAFIDALAPKTWEWSADGSKGAGFIAHEVQAVSPGSVTGEKDAVDADGKPVYQAMEYGSAEFIANIVAELQSLRKRLAALEQK